MIWSEVAKFGNGCSSQLLCTLGLRLGWVRVRIRVKVRVRVSVVFIFVMYIIMSMYVFTGVLHAACLCLSQCVCFVDMINIIACEILSFAYSCLG